MAEKAGRVLDLSAGYWQGTPLDPKDYSIRADEKTRIQARRRCQPSLPSAPGRVTRIEPEYERGGAVQYLAAGDVRRGLVRGGCEPATGIEPFGRLVAQVREQEPYGAAERVFWVVDNGSAQRGEAATRRLTKAYANVILVHTPCPGQLAQPREIYFSLVQRKVLSPNAFASLAEVEQRLHVYEELANRQPHPFAWKFTRAKLLEFLERLQTHEALRTPGAPTLASPDSDQHELLAA